MKNERTTVAQGKRYAADMNCLPILTKEDERKWIAMYHETGDQHAKEVLVMNNLRYVRKIASSFNYSSVRLELDDLVQEGSMGLMKAIERFDYKKECRLSTFATYWIKQYIQRAIAKKGRLIRLPVNIFNDILKLYYEECTLEHVTDKVERLKQLSIKTGFSQVKIEQLREYNITPISYDTITEMDYNNRGISVADSNLNSEELSEVLKEVFIYLSEREKEVLAHRYGLNGTEPKTLKEIGEIYHLSGERIRQIEEQAMEKLRIPHRIRRFKEILVKQEVPY